MEYMFSSSPFNQDLSQWTPYSLEHCREMFEDCLATEPYWLSYLNKENRAHAIKCYQEAFQLNAKLEHDLKIKGKTYKVKI